MKTLIEIAKEKGARLHTERYTEPDGLYVEIKYTTLTEAQLQATFDEYCKQFEAAGELRCDATTGHTYSPFWYNNISPPIGTKVYLEPQIPSEVKPPQDLLDIRDINERMLEELSNRFKLRIGELNSLAYDDTQRGVEFAFEYLTPYLKAKPDCLKG